MPAAGAAVAAERHDQGGRSPTERLVRQPPCDRVTRHALATTPAAPAIGIDDPTGQDRPARFQTLARHLQRSEEHTSELQSLMLISYAVFCLKKKTNKTLKRQ